MNSMTGYGYKEKVVDGTQVSVEIRSVNSRFLDLNINLPPYLNALEQRIRACVGERITRGKVDVTVRVRDSSSNTTVCVDESAVSAYIDAFRRIAARLDDGKSNPDIPLSLIASQEGVLTLTHDYDPEQYWKKIEAVFNEAMDEFTADRKREGENLKKDLLEKLDVLDRCAAFFKDWQPKMESKFREGITKRFEELLGDKVDQNKILEETASLLVKYTINEEIIRLFSHLESLRNEICTNPVPGKRMDFICQEANREINTIGSKNQFTEVGAMVVNAKDALENIREQGKNVE